VKQAISEFEVMGIGERITVTHRDVCSNGFLLEEKDLRSQVDSVFLDLPSP
jgi:tRNA A58 N-methylase Trm61